VEAISFAPDGRYLAARAGSYPSVVWVWDLATGDELMATESDFGPIEFLALAPSGLPLEAPAEGIGPLVGVKQLGEIVVWDMIGPNTEMRTFEGAPVGTAVLGREGTDLITMEAREIVRWDLATGERKAQPHPTHIKSYVAVSADAERMARVAQDVIFVWRADTDGSDCNLEWTLGGRHAGTVRSIAFSPDGHTLASGGKDNTVRC
jgi:WD40 repeat protein